MRYAAMEWSAEAIARRDERDIDSKSAEIAVERGEIVEDSHRPGRELPTRIYLDYVDGRPIHVVVAYDDDRAFGRVITVYEPTPDRWRRGFRERRRP